jgi:signal transduction histidine kinase
MNSGPQGTRDAALIESASSFRSFGHGDEDRDSLTVLHIGCGFAIAVTIVYLAWQITARGFFASGILCIWIALAEVIVFYAGLRSAPILIFWKEWTLLFSTLLMLTFAIFGDYVNDTEVTFVGALLCPLATSAYVAWGPSWQLALNVASIAIFFIVPNLDSDFSPYRPAQWLGLVAGLAFAQSGSVFLDRYRRRVRQQVHDLETAALFREAQIAAMAHDVRSPLAALGGYAALLQAEELPPAERVDLISRLGATAWNMDLVVSNLLDMYQFQERKLAAEPPETDLNAMLHEISNDCAMQAQRRGVDLERELEPLPRCRYDPRHIERIVKNLVGFAIARANSHGVRMKCRPHENQIRIEVFDQGPSMSDAELLALMAPIETSRGANPAHGLNLYVARLMTETAGGIFRVERGETRGLTLISELPVEGQPAPHSPR